MRAMTLVTAILIAILLGTLINNADLLARLLPRAGEEVRPGATEVLRAVSAAELTTQRLEVETSGIEAERAAFGWGLFGGERIRMTVVGEVRAGIDQSAIGPEDVTVRDDGTILLELPPARILGEPTLDEARTTVDDRQLSAVWSYISDELVSKARAAGARDLRTAACARGILRAAADESAREVGRVLALAFPTARIVVIPHVGPC